MAKIEEKLTPQKPKQKVMVSNLRESNEYKPFKESRSNSSSVVSIYSNKAATYLPNLNNSFEGSGDASYLDSTPNINKVRNYVNLNLLEKWKKKNY